MKRRARNCCAAAASVHVHLRDALRQRHADGIASSVPGAISRQRKERDMPLQRLDQHGVAAIGISYIADDDALASRRPVGYLRRECLDSFCAVGAVAIGMGGVKKVTAAGGRRVERDQQISLVDYGLPARRQQRESAVAT